MPPPIRRSFVTIEDVNIPYGNHYRWSTVIIRFVAGLLNIIKNGSRKTFGIFVFKCKTSSVRTASVKELDGNAEASPRTKRINPMYDVVYTSPFHVCSTSRARKRRKSSTLSTLVHCRKRCILIWVSLQLRLDVLVSALEDKFGESCCMSKDRYWIDT